MDPFYVARNLMAKLCTAVFGNVALQNAVGESVLLRLSKQGVIAMR